MSDQNSISEFLDGINSTEPNIDGVISEGMKNLKSKISDIEVQLEDKEDKAEVKSPIAQTKARNAASLADRAINTYKTKIKPATGVEAGELEVSQPSTKASREAMKAAIRAITGGRSSGNVGKPSPTGPNGNGNEGTNNLPPVGLLATSMTIEEYKDHIWGSFGLLDEAEVSEEEVIEHSFAEELDLVSILEDALLEGDTRDWMEVDYLARQVCLEHSVTLKELNKAFKDVHGLYPDKWIKEQVETTACGWMPLDEATRVNKIGLVYEVSFMHRGHVNRYKFFWPNMTRPSKEEIQSAIEGFYPKAKVLAFYPAAKQDDNFMVIVPPMSEKFEVFRHEDWEELSEETNEVFHLIAEEVGEPIGSIVNTEEGNYSIVVESHDTGEELSIEFCEDWQKVNRKDKTDGMSQKAVNAYRRENPGSKLKTAVTEKNPSGKRAGRRKSFCARSKGWDGERGKAARARWNC